jgi:hypothetical protein
MASLPISSFVDMIFTFLNIFCLISRDYAKRWRAVCSEWGRCPQTPGAVAPLFRMGALPPSPRSGEYIHLYLYTFTGFGKTAAAFLPQRLSLPPPSARNFHVRARRAAAGGAIPASPGSGELRSQPGAGVKVLRGFCCGNPPVLNPHPVYSLIHLQFFNTHKLYSFA